MIFRTYCLGFLFSNDREIVVLIRKAKPEWQVGKLNGVGGKVEENEVPLYAMTREFKEETGVDIPHARWERFAMMGSKDWLVHCFRAFDDAAYTVRSVTEERVERVGVMGVFPGNAGMMSNLSWLIPLALDRGTNAEGAPSMVEARYD